MANLASQPCDHFLRSDKRGHGINPGKTIALETNRRQGWKSNDGSKMGEKLKQLVHDKSEKSGRREDRGTHHDGRSDWV